MKKTLFVLLPSLFLSACASQFTTNGEHLYLQSRNGLRLNVPPPLTSANLSHFYLLPQQTEAPGVSIVSPALNNA